MPEDFSEKKSSSRVRRKVSHDDCDNLMFGNYPDTSEGSLRFLTLNPDLLCRACGDSWRVVRTVMSHYYLSGMDMAGIKSTVVKSIEAYSTLVKAGMHIKYLKYKTALIFSWGTNQAPPEVPEEVGTDLSATLLGGRFYSFLGTMKRRLSYDGKDDLRLLRRIDAYSFFAGHLQLKFGFPRPDKKSLKIAREKWYQAIGTKRVSSELDEFHKEHVKIVLRKTVKDVFAKQCVDWGRLEASWPSSKACYNGSRSTGGSLPDVFDALLVDSRDDLGVEIDEIADTMKDSRYVTVIQPTDFFCKPPDYDYSMGFYFESEPREDDSLDGIVPEVPLLLFKRSDRLISLQQRLVQMALYEEPSAEPVALAEPLKIRMISKGPRYTYAALMPLQKLLWRNLSRFPQFLINKPITGVILREVLGTLEDPEDDGISTSLLKWCSGDYSAATDNLDPELSLYCIEVIAEVLGMPDDYAELFRRAMVGHTLMDKGEFKGVQAWGQLMGSVVSFPILCLVNMALIRTALHVFGKQEICNLSIYPRLKPKLPPLKKERILVNGDDCVFPATLEQRDIWEKLAKSCGLPISIGKSYFSAEFLMMNSALFLNEVVMSRGDDECLHFGYRRVPVVNPGLLFGEKRTGKVDHRSGTKNFSWDGSIGSRARDLISPFSEPEFREKAIRLYIAIHRSKLPDGIPWFIPEKFGGLGLPEGNCSKLQASGYDKSRCAHYISLEKQGANVDWPSRALDLEGVTFTGFYALASDYLKNAFTDQATQKYSDPSEIQWLTVFAGYKWAHEQERRRYDWVMEARRFWTKTHAVKVAVTPQEKISEISTELHLTLLGHGSLPLYYDEGYIPRQKHPQVQCLLL